MDLLYQNYQAKIKNNSIKTKHLSKIININKFLAKHWLAIRDHDESADSENKRNFLELCELFENQDNEFSTKFKTYFNLSSSKIQDDIIDSIKTLIVYKIRNEIHHAQFYSVQANKAKSHLTSL